MVGEKKSRTFIKAMCYLLPALVIIGIFVVYPMFHTVRMSFFDKFNIFTYEGTGFGLNSYRKVLNDKTFFLAVKNTFIYTIVTVPVSMAISLLLAILLNKGLKAAKVFQTAYFLPYVTNAIAIGLAFRFIFHSSYGIVNKVIELFGGTPQQWLNSPSLALPTLCIYGVWSALAFKIVIFLAGLQSIDPQLYQAARIDEASSWKMFYKITVPQLKPILVYQFVIAIISSFKTYVEVVGIFGDDGPLHSAVTMVYYMYDQFYGYADYSKAAASGVLMFLVIMVFTLIQLRISRNKD